MRVLGTIVLCWLLLQTRLAFAAEPPIPPKSAAWTPNPMLTSSQKDEPLAKQFSRDRAVQFLDAAAVAWQQQHKCFTCHTNYAYLYARPLVSADAEPHRIVRSFAEELVAQRWPKHGPRWDAEVVATAAALAFNDATTTGKLHATTREALARMWKLQRPDGGWSWIHCNWPPMESDDEYGACLAAVAVGVAPENYRHTDAAQNGVAKIRDYFTKSPPPTLHHEAMLLWASSYGVDVLSDQQRQAVVKKLRALQQTDGGWALSSLGNWKREDNSPQSTDSDGYGTGFVAYVLRRAGAPPDDPALVRAVAWLKTHQRESGRWFTRSLKKDSRHYITHAGTAFALMALAECELPLKKTLAPPQ